MRRLAPSGYLLAAGGSTALAIAFALHLGSVGLFLAVAAFGAAMGAMETLEPAPMAKISPKGRTRSGMGALTAGRSLGLFVANLALGFLYGLSYAYSYGYAALLGVAASVVSRLEWPRISATRCSGTPLPSSRWAQVCRS